jgi:hypothetical protein
VDYIVNSWPLKDLPSVAHFDKTTNEMMHGDEGIGVNGLKELDPDPSTHDGLMKHCPSHIHYELVPPLPVVSNHRLFLLSKSRQPMTALMAIPTSFQSILCSIMLAFDMRHFFLFCVLYFVL